jgi:hypothetical protein
MRGADAHNNTIGRGVIHSGRGLRCPDGGNPEGRRPIATAGPGPCAPDPLCIGAAAGVLQGLRSGPADRLICCPCRPGPGPAAGLSAYA